jgi:hypothetical protein
MNSFYFYKTLEWDYNLLKSNYEKILSPVEFLTETVEEKTLEKFLGGYELFCIHPKRTAKSLLEKRLQGKTLVRGEYKGLEAVILLEEGSSNSDRVSVFIRVPYSIKSREDLEMILYSRSYGYPEEKYFSRIPIDDMGPIREDLWIERTNFSQNLMDRYYDKGSFSIKVEDRKEYFVVEGRS